MPRGVILGVRYSGRAEDFVEGRCASCIAPHSASPLGPRTLPCVGRRVATFCAGGANSIQGAASKGDSPSATSGRSCPHLGHRAPIDCSAGRCIIIGTPIGDNARPYGCSAVILAAITVAAISMRTIPTRGNMAFIVLHMVSRSHSGM